MGTSVPYCVAVLTELVQQGHRLILYTMRSGEHLKAATEWFAAHKLPLYGVNENPGQHTWTASPKVYAQVYIDDAALGCPVIHPEGDERPYVDWRAVHSLLRQRGLLRSTP